MRASREVIILASRSSLLKRRTAWALVLAGLLLVVLVFFLSPLHRHAGAIWRRLAGGATVAQRLEQHGPAARERLRPFFIEAGINYPPAQLTLIGIKDRKELELWARNRDGPFRLVRTYPILAASGQLGPKLREGDRQVPEGLYRIESLHPNSMFHLALRVDYPNLDDRSRAEADGRSDLGGDIMIHGGAASIGCLAMGDQAAEDLFVLVADVGLASTDLILTPIDFRSSTQQIESTELPLWTGQLYAQISQRLSQFHDAEQGADEKSSPR